MRSLSFPLIVLSALLITPSAVHAQCPFLVEGAGRALTYRFEAESTPTGLVLRVTLEFQAGPTGIEVLEVPAHWAGETLQAMANLRVLSRGGSIEEGRSSDTKMLRPLIDDSGSVAFVDASMENASPLWYDFGGPPGEANDGFSASDTSRVLAIRRGTEPFAITRFCGSPIPEEVS
jgi:hypothetical protein